MKPTGFYNHYRSVVRNNLGKQEIKVRPKRRKRWRIKKCATIKTEDLSMGAFQANGRSGYNKGPCRGSYGQGANRGSYCQGANRRRGSYGQSTGRAATVREVTVIV